MLGILTFLGLVSAGIGAALLSDRRKRLAVWRRAADELGIELHGEKLGEPIGMHGVIGGCAIDAECSAGSRTAFLHVHVLNRGLPFSAVWQGKSSFFARDRRSNTGDDLFDDHFELNGQDAILTAVLSAHVRQEMLALEVSRQGHVLALSLGLATDASVIAAHTRRVVDLANALHVEMGTLAEKLAATLASERWNASRRKQLLTLLALGDGAEEIKQHALERALDDASDPECRFIAAKRLGEKNFGERAAAAMRAIAFDGSVEGGLRVRALLLLPPGEETNVERALIEVLGDVDPDAQRAAANALEKVGTIAAVEPLRVAGEGVFTSLRLKHAVGSAIGAIQSRLHGAEKGGLSLLAESSESGALSVPPAERGALSLKKD